MIVAKVDVKLVTILRLICRKTKPNQSDICLPFDQDIDVNHQDAKEALNEIRLKNINNAVIAYLNVNSYRNKYDSLKVLIPGNLDIMILSEMKLDDSFPTSQFLIEGFKEPFRVDKYRYSGGTLIYINEQIPCKQLKKHNLSEDIEAMFIELNFRKIKWLLLGRYHPPNQNDEYFFRNISNALDTSIKTFEILAMP